MPRRPNSSCTLLDLLQNTLILNHVSPYVNTGLVALAATSHPFRDLIYSTPSVFRYIDLSNVPSCYDFGRTSFQQVRGDRDTSMMVVDEFFSQSLHHVFDSLRRHHVLQDIRTLILDELTVPGAIVREMLCDDDYNIRILSLRGTRFLGCDKLIQILRYIIRPSRPEGMPKLKGLYYFTPVDVHANSTSLSFLHGIRDLGVMNSTGAQLGASTASSGAMHQQLNKSSWYQKNPWYSTRGQIFNIDSRVREPWAQLIQACENLIAFDAVLCRNGSNHLNTSGELATVSLGGCQICGSCPEGPACPGVSAASELPLLTPVPAHQSSIKFAQRLNTSGDPHPLLIARCKPCLKDRWCERCNIWWCESCYTIPSKRNGALSLNSGASEPSIKVGVEKHCFECGRLCSLCLELNERQCETCREDYCKEHDSGCNMKNCAWCATGGRRTAMLDY